MLDSTVRSKLEQAAGKPGSVAEPLARYTSLGCGGPAAFLVEAESSAQLAAVLAIAAAEEIPWFVLGRGSNLLVADAGWDGMVIRLAGDFKNYSIKGTTMEAGAGVMLSKLASAAADNGLSGLEPLSLIPGTIGGAVAMNAGAHGTAFADLLVSVELCRAGEVVSLPRSELSFSYRNCRLPSGAVVCRAVLQLVAASSEEVRGSMEEFKRKRGGNQPTGSRTCGSVFKNPGDSSAGKLLDQAGCKGLQAGDAEVSTVHANFIINKGNASAADVLDLMDRCRRMVFEQTGTVLEPEVRFLGELKLEQLV